ncbi:MAG: heat-inducible transcriptional repressor HrcA [Candidatus Aminicenantes bacterium]|nr:heat-inducible transcriptional repressor HrcA [Candidatus Aminicenantes bacterium]
MTQSGLREKDRTVLRTIVEIYLQSGCPVSSGLIHGRKTLNDSPATIRNIMVKLEEMGYLTQPHASAGRVPTDLGLRFYVNTLLVDGPRGGEEPEIAMEGLASRRGDLNALLDGASRLLADGSDSVGFVLSPRVSRINFQHLRFVQIGEAKVMVILVTTFNMVLTEIVAVETDFTQPELDRASQYINQNFAGKSLASVRDYLLRDLPRAKSQFDQAFGRLMSLLKSSVTQEEKEPPIFVQGASRLIDKFDEADMTVLKTLLKSFEEKANLAKLLSDFIALDRVKVLIGAEANVPEIADCSLILSHYGDAHQVLGSLGIIGPKRLPYQKIIPLVDHVATKLSRTITRKPS